MAIRVALAEDNHLLAASIIEKMELFPQEIHFAFHAVDGKELLERLRTDSAVDVILMDIEMPEMDGIRATEQVAAQYPQIKILILTVFDDEKCIFEAIQAGAMGYLLKDETPQKLLESIRMIINGGAPMSPGIAAKALLLLRNPDRASKTDTENNLDLTNREIEVLNQLSHGHSYREISENLYISPATVRKHIENIYRKLQVNNKMRAIKKAADHGLL